MPRIVVTTDLRHPSVLLDEHVQSIHLASGHAAEQLVERLAWAIADAEEAEGAQTGAFEALGVRGRSRVHAAAPRHPARPRSLAA